MTKHNWTRIIPPPPPQPVLYSGIFIPTYPDADTRPGVIIPHGARVVDGLSTPPPPPVIALRDGKYPYTHRSLCNRYRLGGDVPEWWRVENDLPTVPDVIQTAAGLLQVL
jgi:hypothetical protein